MGRWGGIQILFYTRRSLDFHYFSGIDFRQDRRDRIQNTRAGIRGRADRFQTGVCNMSEDYKDAEMAEKLLKWENLTLVMVKGGECLYRGRGMGLRELLEAIRLNGENLKGGCCADRIVGKAAAMLMVYAGIVHVHGEVMSEAADELLDSRGVAHTAAQKVPQIKNRAGNDMCPMEKRSLTIESPEEAYRVFSAMGGVLH